MKNYLITGWDAGELSGLDPQIAVSSTHVMVYGGGTFAFFDKLGAQVGLKIGANDFFAKYGLHFDASEKGPGFGGGDTRLLFDNYRKRFWALTTFNSGNKPPDKALWYPLMYGVAVSKTENPADGFYAYKLFASPVDSFGTVNPIHACDYPSIGIDEKAFYICIDVFDQTGVQADTAGGWVATNVIVRDADAMSHGVHETAVKHYAFAVSDPRAESLAPATHLDSNIFSVLHLSQSNVDTRKAFFASRTGDVITVFVLTDPLGKIHTNFDRAIDVNVSPSGEYPPNGSQKNGKGSVRLVLGHNVMSHVYRNKKLYMTSGDSLKKDSHKLRSACRITVIDLATLPVGDSSPVQLSVPTDQVFGWATPQEEAAGKSFHYGCPSLSVNKNGDIGVITVRTNEEIYPELRVSAYGAGEAGISPSILLKGGENAVDTSRWGDLFGASIDPSDPLAIWVVGQYANKSGLMKVYVGRLIH